MDLILYNDIFVYTLINYFYYRIRGNVPKDFSVGSSTNCYRQRSCFQPQVRERAAGGNATVAATLRRFLREGRVEPAHGGRYRFARIAPNEVATTVNCERMKQGAFPMAFATPP